VRTEMNLGEVKQKQEKQCEYYTTHSLFIFKVELNLKVLKNKRLCKIKVPPKEGRDKREGLKILSHTRDSAVMIFCTCLQLKNKSYIYMSFFFI